MPICIGQHSEAPDLLAAWPLVSLCMEEAPYHPVLPQVKELVETDPEGWCGHLRGRLLEEVYEPQPPLQLHDFWDGRSRQPWCLQPADHLLYTACVEGITPALLAAGINNRALCGPLFAACSGKQWIHEHRCWADLFRARTERAYEEGYRFVAVTDVSNFFASVRHDYLREYLRSLDVSGERLELLFQLLARWFPTGRGLPWNLASHVLCAAFLNQTDRLLLKLGFRHLRMVDDLRVFCKTEEEAQEALQLVRGAFLELDLQINLSKTRVHPLKTLISKSLTKTLHQWTADRIVGTVRRLENTSRPNLAYWPRRFIYHFLGQLYRPYLGYLTSRLPSLDVTLKDFAEGRIPAAYIHLVRDSIPGASLSQETLTALSDASLCVGPRSGLCRLILADAGLSALRPPAPPGDEESELERLETLFFLQLYRPAARSKVLKRFQPRTYLERWALERLR